MPKEITLTKGYVAIVDDEYYDYLSQFSWNARVVKNTVYAKRSTPDTTINMHREIMGVTDSKIMVDHIDRNGLNNQKSNLRICTRSNNLMNSKKPTKGKTSKYKGVSFVKDPRQHNKPWRAEIRLNKKGILIGYFKTEREAALGYNKKALELFGEFCRLNEVCDE